MGKIVGDAEGGGVGAGDTAARTFTGHVQPSQHISMAMARANAFVLLHYYARTKVSCRSCTRRKMQ